MKRISLPGVTAKYFIQKSRNLLNLLTRVSNTGKGVLGIIQDWFEPLRLGLQEWANILEPYTPQKKDELSKSFRLLSVRCFGALYAIMC